MCYVVKVGQNPEPEGERQGVPEVSTGCQETLASASVEMTTTFPFAFNHHEINLNSTRFWTYF